MEASTQTDDESLRLQLERLPDRQLHTAVFYKVAKERLVDAMACVAHPLLEGPPALDLHLIDQVTEPGEDNASLAGTLLEDIEKQHLIPDLSLRDARCDLCKHRYFPLRADSPVVYEIPDYSPLTLVVPATRPSALLRHLEDVADLCGEPQVSDKYDDVPCGPCIGSWLSHCVHGGSACNFAVDALMQGEWLKERWPIDIGHGTDAVLATVCLACVRKHMCRGVVRAAVPEDVLKAVVKDVKRLDEIWFRARRLTAAGVRGLL